MFIGLQTTWEPLPAHSHVTCHVFMFVLGVFSAMWDALSFLLGEIACRFEADGCPPYGGGGLRLSRRKN